MNEKIYWVWLTVTMKFAAAAINRVLYKFTPEGAYNATEEELAAAGIDSTSIKKLREKSLVAAKIILGECEDNNIKIVTSVDPEYPRALDRLADKPNVLYVRGDLNCLKGKKTACFIGTRRMTRTGEEFGEKYADKLIKDGNILVSGIAAGIDTLAAEESIRLGVPTVAVLGVDIDRYFPAENRFLIDRVAVTGAVISEYPPKTGARYFPERNRIIVGLSDTVTVIEAPQKSGSLIGAKLAMNLGIPTAACDFEGETFDGCRELIKLGADTLTAEGKIILNKKPKKTATKTTRTKRAKEEVEEAPFKKREMPTDLNPLQQFIYEKLLEGTQKENVFFDHCENVSAVIVALSEMELKGYIESLPGCKYKLKD